MIDATARRKALLEARVEKAARMARPPVAKAPRAAWMTPREARSARAPSNRVEALFERTAFARDSSAWRDNVTRINRTAARTKSAEALAKVTQRTLWASHRREMGLARKGMRTGPRERTSAYDHRDAALAMTKALGRASGLDKLQRDAFWAIRSLRKDPVHRELIGKCATAKTVRDFGAKWDDGTEPAGRCCVQ